METILLVLFFALALVNWLVVLRGRIDLEYVVKPVALAALLLFAAAVPEPSLWLLAALVLSLLGDVYLMLPGNYFLPGLAAFLFGHLAYIAAFGLPLAASLPWFVVMSVATLPVTVPVLRSITQTGLKAAVVLYMAVICFMAAAAIASGSTVAVAGALLFVVSDSILAWDMFVRKLPRAHLWVMISYHLAQVGLVWALTTM